MSRDGKCLKIAANFNPPFMTVAGRTAPYQVGGFLVEVFDILARYLNTCYQFVVPPDGLFGHRLPNGTLTGSLGLINRSEADLTSALTLTWERTYYTDFSEPLFMDDFVVTYKRPVLEADLQGFIKPFTPLLWVLVLVSVVVTFAFTWGVFKASHLLHYTRVEGEGTGVTEERKGGDLIYTAEKSILWTYSLLVGQSVPWEPQRAWVRVLPGFWLLSTLILGSVYRSNLKAMLIMPKVRLPFNTIQELEATGISLCVPEGNAVHQAIMEADVTSKLGSLKKQLIVPVDMLKAAKDTKEGDFACSTPLFIVMFYLNLYKLTDGECILYIMSERILGARSMVFMMPKGSPLKTRVDRVIRGLKEMGILEHLVMRSMPHAAFCMKPVTATVDTQELRALEVTDFYGVFAIYAGGVMLAALTFFLELIIG